MTETGLSFRPDRARSIVLGHKDLTRRIKKTDKCPHKPGDHVWLLTTWGVPGTYDHLRPKQLLMVPFSERRWWDAS